MGALVATDLKVLLRSAEFLVVTLLMPIGFFLIFADIFGDANAGSLDMATYMMISMAAFGAISAALTTGARVSLERREGWNRQLRLTPLPGWSYVASKAIVAMLVILPVIALVLLVGMLVKGVELSAAEWLQLLAVSWLCSLSFAFLGLLVGMSVSPDAASAISVTAFIGFAVLGGLFMPVDVLPSAMQGLAELLPSFWLGENARLQLSGGAFEPLGLVVMAAWLVLAAGAVLVLYRRDARRF